MINYNFDSCFKKQASFFNLDTLLVIVLLLVCFLTVDVSQAFAQTNAQTSTKKRPIEVELLVQNLSLRRPQALLSEDLHSGKSTNVIIHNQPQAQATIKSVKQLPITTLIPQPDGSVKEVPDLTLHFSTNLLITLSSTAQIEDSGLVLGKDEIKIGNNIGLSGFNYDFKATVIDLRILQN
jgi:Domain of unknown function (DUF4330)